MQTLILTFVTGVDFESCLANTLQGKRFEFNSYTKPGVHSAKAEECITLITKAEEYMTLIIEI